MACGKTTLGRALQAAYPEEIEFADLDEIIEERAGMSITQIFAEKGERAFRLMESEEVDRLCARKSEGRRLIVGCGGGTPCHGRNLDRMLEEGTVVWLKANRERTLSRLIEFQATRPLLAGKSVEELAIFADIHLAERTPCYSRAHRCFDSSYLDTAGEVATSVERFYNEFIRLS